MPTAYRTCPLCEATCGLELTLGDAGEVLKVRGDEQDVFSRGFLCPKGTSLRELHEDPDRLRVPLVKGPDGVHREAGWDEAFAEIHRRLPPLMAEHGRDAVAVYNGNPTAHNLAALLYGRLLLKALGTKNLFSASTVDQQPKQLAVAHLFGTGLSVPLPDLDRTDHLLVLGANPMASNGSLMTAPDVRGRLRAIRARGGRIVVVDPRRTRTAQEADEHVAIRPGTDAFLLLAMVHVLVTEDLVDLGDAAPHVTGVEEVRELALGCTPEDAAERCGIEADTVRRLARDLAAADRGVVYGRIGTTTQRFGTAASWLVDVLNTLTGNLDRPGGAMFATPAAGVGNTTGAPGRGRGARPSRHASRVRGLPEVFGELPVAALAEEIETPGPGQVRALLTIAGNPVLSTPNAGRLDAALRTLDFMVSVDLYLNETTRHADVVLPALSPLEHSHFDLVFTVFAIRDVANYSPAVVAPPPGALDEWETLVRLLGIVTGQGPDADVTAIDDVIATEAVRRAVGDEHSPLAGRDVDDVLADLAPRTGPERLLDLALRTGPYRLTLADLEAAPHGLDLGPLKPRLPEVLRTPSGKVELAPEPLLADGRRLVDALGEPAPSDEQMLLIGRRDLRSNNSWMHNLPVLVRGKARCTAHVHPEDAARLGLVDGAPARVTSRTGTIEVPVELTEDIRPGVVSIPHGWGHGVGGARLGVAAEHAGVNSNVLADEELLEPVTGTAVLNGIPVTVEPAGTPDAVGAAGAASTA